MGGCWGYMMHSDHINVNRIEHAPVRLLDGQRRPHRVDDEAVGLAAAIGGCSRGSGSKGVAAD